MPRSTRRGVIRVDTPNELLDVGEAFSRCKPAKGKPHCHSHGRRQGTGLWPRTPPSSSGLNAFVLSDVTQRKIREILKPHCPVKNQVDLAGTPEADMWVFDRCMEVLLADPEVDGPGYRPAFMAGIATFRKNSGSWKWMWPRAS